VRAAPAAVLAALVAAGCGGAARQAGPEGHIEAGASFAQGGPDQIAFDRAGSLYGVDCQDSWIFRVDSGGRLWIVGGTGEQGFTGNGGSAAEAQFTCPAGIALDAVGNVFVADHDNRVRWIDRRGVVHAFAGAGAIPPLDSHAGSFGGDGGPARGAHLRAPTDLAFDPHGNLYISDSGNDAVRRIDSEGTVTTVARLVQPSGLAFDAHGALYVATPHGIERVAKGSMTLFARIAHPDGLAFDAHGDLYVAQPLANVVRRIDRRGTIAIVAGTGRPGEAGDGGPAVRARLTTPETVAVDGRGDLYIGDQGSGAIRKVDARGTITTFFSGRS